MIITKYMETSLYEITFKDGRIFRVFCANRRQNKDMLRFLSSAKAQNEIKRKGAVVVRNGIHTMKQFETIINNDK